MTPVLCMGPWSASLGIASVRGGASGSQNSGACHRRI